MMNSTATGQHGASGIRYRSSLHCLQQTLRIEGVRGLFKGSRLSVLVAVVNP